MTDWSDRLNLVCFEPLKHERPWELATYRKIGGYEAWRTDPRGEDPARADHRGGEGVGPARPRRRRIPDRAQVVVHAAQRPGAEVRGLQLGRERAGHLPRPRHPALQPARARSRAWPSPATRWAPRSGYNYVRGEFMAEPIPRFEAALKEAYAAGLLGRNVLGSGVDFDLHTFVGAGAYICGEETALLESLEGKQGKPRFKPPFPANYGLYGKPTTINNAQSFASVPDHPAQGPGVVLEPGAAELGRHGHLLGLRPRREARQLRAAARHPVQGPARDRGRSARRAQAQGRDPGRLLGARGAGRDHARRQHGLRLAARRRVRRSARPP